LKEAIGLFWRGHRKESILDDSGESGRDTQYVSNSDAIDI